MIKGEDPKQFRKNLRNLNTNTVHASGSVWKMYGPICRCLTTFREVEAYIETDDKMNCKTCMRMRNMA